MAPPLLRLNERKPQGIGAGKTDSFVAAMIRFLLRFIGLICLAGGFILLIYDGTKSIAGNKLFLTDVQTLWELVNPGSLAKLKPMIEHYAGGFLWDQLMVTFLSAPSWSVLGVLGILFILLGRRRKPLIGYVRP